MIRVIFSGRTLLDADRDIRSILNEEKKLHGIGGNGNYKNCWKEKSYQVQDKQYYDVIVDILED